MATARAALEDRGIEDATDHILVATTPAVGTGGSLSTILVKEEPFTARGGRALHRDRRPTTDEATLRYAPGRTTTPNLDRLAGRPCPTTELDDVLDDYPFDVDAITRQRAVLLALHARSTT